MRIRLLFCTFVAVVTLSSPVFAHHGNTQYDEKHPITLKGTVAQFVWSNPHTQIYFDVKDADGKIVRWGCETFNPARLSRGGWTKNTLKPGDEITITLQAARNGAPVGFLKKVVLANGQEFVPADHQ